MLDFCRLGRGIVWIGAGLLVLVVSAHARLGRDVRPVFQYIELQLNPDTTHYRGTVRVDLEVVTRTDSFQFHAEEMRLDRVVLSGLRGMIPSSWESAAKGLTTVRCEQPLSPGRYRLEIEFANDFGTRAVGLYRVVDGGQGYLFTQFEEDDAREAFPCWDEPEFKIPFQMTLTVPESVLAVSNTPVERVETMAGWRKVTFRRTKPLPTYLLAVAVGPFDTVAIPGMSVPGRVVTVRGRADMASLASRMTPPILAALERYFGSPYPYAKLDLIAVPEFWAGAMENVGAVTFRETILLLDERRASVGQRRRLAGVIAHELAHMWFGNLVTMTWWDDLWLNESFASWIGRKRTGELYPEFNMPVQVVRRSQGVMDGDARKTTSPVRQPTGDDDNLLRNIGVIYAKGEAVLYMFEQWLGAETFRRGVIRYLYDHAWGNAAAEDFWNALSEMSGRDIAGPLSTFIEQPGVPLVTVMADRNGMLTVTQERFANYGVSFPDTIHWEIPVRMKYAVDGRVDSLALLLTARRARVPLPEGRRPDWILPNAGMAGYYRWSVPATMLRAMADRMPGAFTTAERVGFLSNLSALLDAGRVSGREYLSVLQRFGADPAPEVVSTVISMLGGVRRVFIDDHNRAAFAAFVRRTLQPTVERFGLLPRAGEPEAVALMRPSLLGFMADEGDDTAALNIATVLADRYLQQPESVPAELAGVALSLAALRGDSALFEEYRRRFENATTPVERSRFLSTLGAFRDSTLVMRALAYALQGPLRPQERQTIPRTVAAQSPERADLVFDLLMAHYDEIVAWLPPPARAYLVFYADGCSEERLAKAREFFNAPERQSPGLQHRLERVAESVRDCVGLREREQDAVEAFLSQYAAADDGM